ncbi:unnamed protein product [Durusdinium trenchii]|uniref:Uncharacterized protein n=2 Tax=Durusdinium trenchii TaxID=1381693 RepID=A0ABP0SCD9_9DINO
MALLNLLLSSGFIASAALPSEYLESNYTIMTVTTERYACHGPLTGGNDATKVDRKMLGPGRCSSERSYFECSATGSKVGHFDCSNDKLIEEFSGSGCFRCDDYMFECRTIWFKGKYYDGKYFKLSCDKQYSSSSHSIVGPTSWTPAVLAGAIALSSGISG